MLYIAASAGLISLLASRSILGCMASVPGDLSIFSFLSLSLTLAAVTLMSSNGVSVCRGSNVGIAPSGSDVKTLLKKLPSISAFLLVRLC